MNKEQEEQIVKLVEERFGVKAKPVDKSRCCVEDPPDTARDVNLVKGSLRAEHNYTAWFWIDDWYLCGSGQSGEGSFSARFPRSAMVGKRWVEKE